MSKRSRYEYEDEIEGENITYQPPTSIRRLNTPPMPMVELVSNPRGSPNTRELNNRLAQLQQQDQFIIGLQTNPVSNVLGLGSGSRLGAAGAYQTPQQEEQANLRMFARDIASSWTNYQGEFNAIIQEFEQRNIVSREATRQEYEQTAEQNRAAIFEGLSRGAAGLLLSMIVLAMFTSDTTNERLITLVFAQSPTLSRLFQIISQYIVRPFVSRNLANIQSIPEIMSQGYSSNQISAIMAMIFTGMSAYGITELVQHTGDPMAFASMSASTIAQMIRSSFPIVNRCMRTGVQAGNAVLQCGANLTIQVLSYIDNMFIRNSSGATDEQSQSTADSLDSLSTANSQQIGSVVASILDDPSVTESVREVFEQLSSPGQIQSQSQESSISSLSASQPFFSTDTQEMGGMRRRMRRRRTFKRKTNKTNKINKRRKSNKTNKGHKSNKTNKGRARTYRK